MCCKFRSEDERNKSIDRFKDKYVPYTAYIQNEILIFQDCSGDCKCSNFCIKNEILLSDKKVNVIDVELMD